MNNQYYIDIEGQKDGPHDLVTIMRRIRAHKIGMDTRIFIDNADTPILAKDAPDLKIFFSKQSESPAHDNTKAALFTLHGIIRDGWRFTIEHNIMTVFAGGIILLTILFLASMVSVLGFVFGGMISWIILIMFHYIYLVFSMRLYRGQPISADFMNNQLSPTLSPLLLSAFSFALMVAGGFILLVIPAIIVAVYYIFVPFFIIDRKMSVMEAMTASRLLVCKFNQRYFFTILLLVLAYIGSIILIIPIPLTMPMFAAALIKVYEEMSAA